MKSPFVMKFNLSVEDFTIILNALHYYKKVEKRGNFANYNEMRINAVRDKMAQQFVHMEIDETED